MGQYEYRLKSLADDELLAGLSSIVGRRNRIAAEFLAYLQELDQRQLFLDLGFSSLFQYCVEALGLCESTAGRHIAAARVCRRYPEVFGMVASGALHASALSLLRKHLTPENAGELFELCKRRSARQVEVLLAARFPRPDVRDLVRRFPAQRGRTLNAGRGSEEMPSREPSGAKPSRASSVEPSREPWRAPSLEPQKAFDASPSRVPSAALEAAGPAKSRRLEPLSADRYGVHLTVDGEFCELLERVRGLAAHRLPNGDLMTLFRRGLEAYERELAKERFAVGRKPHPGRRLASVAPAADLPAPELSPPERITHSERTTPERITHSERRTPECATLWMGMSALSASARLEAEAEAGPPKPDIQSKPSPNRKRHISAAVAREVFVRDGQQCTYVSPDGRRCRARRCLELDHVDPWAVGGEGTIDNLRLRCRAHNQRYAQQYFGKSRVEAALRHSRQRRATARWSGRADQP